MAHPEDARRVIVISLIYNAVPMMAAAFARFEATFGIPWGRFEHIYVDQHWPRDRAAGEAWLRERAATPGARILDPGENLGLHRGFNYALKAAEIGPDDIVIGLDPDCFPVEPGWGRALARVIAVDPDTAWASLWTPHTERETQERGFIDGRIAGLEIRQTKAPCLNSICAWPGRFLMATGGLTELNPYYGGLEVHMWKHLVATGKKWVFLKGFREEYAPHELIDPQYRAWKWETTHGGKSQIEFGAWLKERGLS